MASAEGQTPQTVDAHWEIDPGPPWAWIIVLVVIPALFIWAVSHYGDGGIIVGGVVVDEAGAPVAGAVVKLQPPADSDIQLWNDGEHRTFKDGEFGFCPTFRPQRALFTLTASKSGYEPDSKDGFEAPGRYEDIVLVLKATAQ